MSPEERARIDWEKGGGLIAAIVQDAGDGRVLMLGYMNREALDATLRTRQVTFYSRTRRRLWQKGESSGHALLLQEARLDCDGDTLLVSARPQGAVCHTGTATCFGDTPAPAAAAPAAPASAPPAPSPAPASPAPSLEFLRRLEELVAARIAENPEGSYTARLYRSGLRRIAQKLGEEGLEVALAGCGEGDDALLGECADLLYHLLVLLRARSLSLEQVVALLQARHESRMSMAGSRRL